MNNASHHRDGMVLHLRFLRVPILLIGCSIASSCNASDSSSFASLGVLPGCTRSIARAISKDGSVVVGESESKAFRWTEARGMVGLGYLPDGDSSEAYAVSSDGSVVAGGCRIVRGYRAFRWTASGGMIGLGQPHLSESNDTFRAGHLAFTNYTRFARSCNTQAKAISSDGSVVVGNCFYSIDRHEAFRWTAASGMVVLGRLPGDSISRAYAVSADGSVVVGESGQQAFRWTGSGGMVGMGYLPGGSDSLACAISDDGSVIVGNSSSASGHQGFRWTASGGMAGLGYLPGSKDSFAFVVSRDGSIVGGHGYSASGADVFIWDCTNGMRNLQAVLTSNYQMNLIGWKLQSLTGFSADGRTIAGNGKHNGRMEAWIARLARPLNAPPAKK